MFVFSGPAAVASCQFFDPALASQIPPPHLWLEIVGGNLWRWNELSLFAADVPYYPEQMTALAYRFGINYIIYSMTH
jgi:hypothetical protein